MSSAQEAALPTIEHPVDVVNDAVGAARAQAVSDGETARVGSVASCADAKNEAAPSRGDIAKTQQENR